MNDVRAAAERLKSKRHTVTKLLNGHVAIEKQVLFDLHAIVEAYLAEHQPDDDEPWTDEWVKSIAPQYWEAGRECYWPEFGLRFAMKISDFRQGRGYEHGFYFWNEGERSHMQVPSIIPVKTHGQVRHLLKLLRGE